MSMQSKEYTFGATGVITKTFEQLRDTDFPRIHWPAEAIMVYGDDAFTVEINSLSDMALKVYDTPFRLPFITIRINSLTFKGTSTKKIHVCIFGKLSRDVDHPPISQKVK